MKPESDVLVEVISTKYTNSFQTHQIRIACRFRVVGSLARVFSRANLAYRGRRGARGS